MCFPKEGAAFTTLNPHVFLKEVKVLPYRIPVFSQGWGVASKIGVASSHRIVVFSCGGGVAVTTQNPCVFLRGVSPHRVFVLSEGWWSFHHTESSCFPGGGVACTTRNPRVFPGGV